MFDKEITIYNFHKADKTGKWHRTVLSGVHYRYTTEKTVASDGRIIMTPLLTVVIPVEAETGGKQYIDYPSYLKLPENELSSYWTVNPKCNQEVIVCGVCDKEISGDYRITELKEGFLKAGVVSALNDNTDEDLLRHWKVVCR